jgi:NAD(P)-dependent dehydrogenase (short-subunit alcohol dehydrogenase family)
MRILIVGATGTIGKAIADTLGSRHDLLLASHSKAPLTVDIANLDSVQALYRKAGRLDAVISAAGQARFKPFAQLTDEDFAFSLANKLMGQVNLVRYGMDALNDGGSGGPTIATSYFDGFDRIRRSLNDPPAGLHRSKRGLP